MKLNILALDVATKTGCDLLQMVFMQSTDGKKRFHYVYSTANLTNGMIYVGKHSTDDMDDGYMGSGTVFRRAIRKYGKRQFVKTIIQYFETEGELNKGERFWISFFSRSVMYNISDGGEGNLGYRHTDETKSIISQKGDQNPMFGRIHSDETRAKIRDKLKDVPKNIEGLIRYRKTDAMKAHNQKNAAASRRKVNQYSLNGELIKTWESVLQLRRHYATSTVHYWIKKGLIRNNSIYRYD